MHASASSGPATVPDQKHGRKCAQSGGKIEKEELEKIRNVAPSDVLLVPIPPTQPEAVIIDFSYLIWCKGAESTLSGTLAAFSCFS